MDFKIAFTDKEITAWGGMIFMKKLIEKSGITEKLRESELPVQGSNRGYSPLQLIESFWISVWCGANRFMHLDVLRMDATLQKLFGWKRMAGHKGFSDTFQSLQQRSITKSFILYINGFLNNCSLIITPSTLIPLY